MFYHIETDERSAGDRRGTVYTLLHKDDARAEVWPANGNNCLKWQIKVDGAWRDLLYQSPEWDTNPVPTRSGLPILFPFPNRIRDGRFRAAGKTYELALNDSTKKNAIHGWAPRYPWTVFGYSFDEHSAWIHADFQASVNAPEHLKDWPSDYILSVTYRLMENALRVESTVRNVGNSPLPWGLGFHPYFRFPCSDTTIDRCRLHAPARSIWESVDNLPTGDKQPVSDALNWNRPRPVNSTQLDTLYGDLGAIAERADGMLLFAELGHEAHRGALQIWASRDFRESVLFTPPHRQAICIEPYTCATDAINLSEKKVDAGWKVLQPGERWMGAVEFRWEPERDL